RHPPGEEHTDSVPLRTTSNFTHNPFSFNDPATTHIYPLSLHDALPIFTPIPFSGAADRRIFQGIPMPVKEPGSRSTHPTGRTKVPAVFANSFRHRTEYIEECSGRETKKLKSLKAHGAAAPRRMTAVTRDFRHQVPSLLRWR